MNFRGLTLIELLAVIVIVSMTTATMTVSLGAADVQAQFMRLASACQDLDARGRILAQSQGERCVLQIMDEPPRLALVMADSESPFTELEVPVGFRVQMSQDDEPMEAIVFDRNGRSVDYLFFVHHDDVVNTWNVHGLTGQITPGGEVSP